MFSAAFQCTTPRRWGQFAERRWHEPLSSRYAAIMWSPRRSTAPSPGGMSSSTSTSPLRSQSVYGAGECKASASRAPARTGGAALAPLVPLATGAAAASLAGNCAHCHNPLNI